MANARLATARLSRAAAFLSSRPAHSPIFRRRLWSQQLATPDLQKSGQPILELVGHSFPEPSPAASPGLAPPITVTRLDFLSLGFPEYADRYALVIDNIFSEADCTHLLDAANACGPFIPALVNGGKVEYSDTTYRNSGRVIVDDISLADWILGKLRPYLGDIQRPPDNSRHRRHVEEWKKLHGNTAGQLTRLNERLRFLSYGPGEFFKGHCDGQYYTPDRTESSYYTLQLYLSGDPTSLIGGATRFWSMNYDVRGYLRKSSSSPIVRFLDVEPRLGRALIFEQEGLLHTGEPVVEGLKYTVRTDFLYEERKVESDVHE